MTTKADLISQIQQKLFKSRMNLSLDNFGDLMHPLIYDKSVYVVEIPKQNLVSCNKFWIVILRKREKTLIFETTGLLYDKQLKNIADFMRGVDIQDINPVRRYDKNRCVVNY